MTLDEAVVILGALPKRLRMRVSDKAQWEHMTLCGVIMTWGDPRKWDDICGLKDKP